MKASTVSTPAPRSVIYSILLLPIYGEVVGILDILAAVQVHSRTQMWTLSDSVALNRTFVALQKNRCSFFGNNAMKTYVTMIATVYIAAAEQVAYRQSV